MIATDQKTIPKDWQITQIKDVCENLDNKRVPVSKEKRNKGSIPYYGATGVVDYVSDFIFDEELLLIGEDGADWSEFADSAFLIKGKSWVNNHAHVLRCTKINPTFLKNYLNFQNLNNYISGGTRGKLTKGVLEKIPVLAPPFPEQKKIAEILSTVDSEIKKTDEIISQTKKLKKGLMQDLFTKGIGHKKFKKTKIGEIPEEWGVVELADVSKIIDCLHQTPKFSSEGFPMVRVTDIKTGILQLDKALRVDEEVYKKFIGNYEPKKGDIVLSRVGSYGVSSYVNSDELFCIGQNTVVVNPLINNKYLFYVLNSEQVKLQIENECMGSGYKSISLKSIKAFKIPLPPEDEQNKIAEILASVDEKISVNIRYKEILNKLKKGLMQDLLSGKVRIISK
jgi:type I restriction enzyme S subunit